MFAPKYCIFIYFGGLIIAFDKDFDIGHITTGSFMGKENQYIQWVKGLYCKMLTIGKQLPTFPHRILGLNHSPQRWEASVSQQTLPT